MFLLPFGWKNNQRSQVQVVVPEGASFHRPNCLTEPRVDCTPVFDPEEESGDCTELFLSNRMRTPALRTALHTQLSADRREGSGGTSRLLGSSSRGWTTHWHRAETPQGPAISAAESDDWRRGP